MDGWRRLFGVRHWGPELDEGIDWELRHHVEERVDELVAQGWNEAAARAQARRGLGDAAQLKAELRRIGRSRRRSARVSDLLSTIGQDVRYAGQSLRRHASYATAIIVTLGLGIGANGALFSVADALLLRPLPYERPEELVQVLRTTPDDPMGRPYLAPDIARDWLREPAGVADAFASARTNVTYIGGVEPRNLPALAVTASFEETLGVRPVVGRGITAEDMLAGAEPVVLVSHGFRASELAGREQVIGSRIELNGIVHTVVGVMPEGFKYPEYSTTDFWVPLGAENQAFGRRVPYVEMTARVVGDIAAAEPAAAALASALYRRSRPGSDETFALRSLENARARSDELRSAMKVLTGAVVLILLSAGVNMVNLLLLRGAARTRELAIRVALGASRLRLVRQLATEAMLLALLSGVLAAFLAFAGLRLLMRIMPSSIMFFAPHPIEVEGRTVLFTFLLAVLSGVVFGLVPALRMARGVAVEMPGPRAAASSAGTTKLRRFLIATEVALSVTLLVAAGLLIGSFARLARVDPGIDTNRLAVLGLAVSQRDFPDAAQRVAYVSAIEAAILRIPGVEAVALTGGLPPRGAGFSFGVVFETEDGEPRPYDGLLPTTSAAPDFFEVTGARLRAGRTFQRDDAGSGNVIIDERLAAHLWPAGVAVGRRFRLGADAPWLTVIGVAGELRLMGADDRQAQFALIEPVADDDVTRAVLAIRTTADPRTMLPAIRTAVHTINARQVIDELDTARSLYAASMDMQRFLYVVITVLAALALLLTAVGLYGLLAYGVAQRQRELGVRLALGARSHDVRRVVLGEALALAAAGTAAGLAGAAASSRLLEATLYGVEPGDLRTIAAVVGVIFATTAAASLLPARRATDVDPAVVLRAD